MKKDLAMISMTYGNIYAATISMGANPAQTVKALTEAEAYNGPALVIAYSTCIAHGIDMETGMLNQKEVVAAGRVPLYRYNPELTKQGKNPLVLDSKQPTMKFSEQAMKENRFRVLKQMNPKAAEALMAQADRMVLEKYDLLTKLAGLPACSATAAAQPGAPVPAVNT